MGNRGNIFVVQDTKQLMSDGGVCGIYLYTHWHGDRWPDLLRLALDRPTARNRWGDPSFLTRILVNELYDDLGKSETGGGISAQLEDTDHDIIVLECDAERVHFAEPGDERFESRWYGTQTFDEFTAQITADYPAKDATR